MQEGDVLGHEPMGIVEEVGGEVTELKPGDRIVLPFQISCGHCYMCDNGLQTQCETTQVRDEGMGAMLFGYTKLYGHDGRSKDGGQAEFLRVPYADFQLLELPPGTEHENDFTMLSDIFPTGWHGTELARMRPGDRVVVYGAGPVGLLAAHSAMIRGAAQVFIVDKERDRLELAEKIGVTPIDFSREDPVEHVLDATGGRGADCGVEAVGYQAHDATGQEHPELVLDNLVSSVRVPGGIGVVGVYVPQDPGAPNDLAKEGRLAWQYGQFFTKGQWMGTGQCPVMRYNRRLRDLIIAGVAKPSFLVSHELPLEEAPVGYEHFDKRDDGWTKVLLHPGSRS
jgi:glutathione-independent formaldehyde dehydrogenase